MGLTKQHLRYSLEGTFSIISSGGCNITFISYQGQDGRFVACGACECIIIWDLRLGNQALKIPLGVHSEVTYLSSSPDGKRLAAGLSNGSVHVFELLSGEQKAVFVGHRTAVSCLAFDSNGHRLVSGSKDTELVLWDLIDERGLERLTGHRNVVSSALFLKNNNVLISSSKDTFIKFWNLDTSYCYRTIAAHVTEVWTLSLLGNDEYLVAGSNDSSLMVWSLHQNSSESLNAAAVSLANNAVELFSLKSTDVGTNTFTTLRKLVQPGHQGEVRAVAFSSDNLAIASVGADAIKIWNRVSLSCLRTVLTDYALCVCFVPGDRHVIVGLKNGSVLVVDLSTGEVLESIAAHTAEVWSITKTHDNAGVVTASGDSTVKVWKFELVSTESSKAKVLSILHTRTLKVNEPVLSVKVSPCGKLVAASLLDTSTKIFFFDTFKFFLGLYGHKMPVLTSDISYDSSLIVTGSADRSVKIWGLDFGDCHRSLFAHDDSVTAVQFVPKTHLFFSCGKDGKLKQWDGDTFEKIITLDGHFGECWNLAVGGDFVVSCGKDRVLRLYTRTDEILVLEDEMEEERGKDELASGQDSLAKLPSIKTVTAERGVIAYYDYS
ncbi:unnamed protein product [Nesidiocoris tenuis]|uniref:Uncharacterized protein n=1 Tax=Nesidiocoris tenuis TaxID=355587 RepID=A0A6H5GXI3_9HEMI|nr:unnamed protein product [Nesidiocoris tenuis]